MQTDIADIRRELDELDEDMCSLLRRRMKISTQVAKYKLDNGSEIYVPERENAVLSKCALRAGIGLEHQIMAAYNTVMRISRGEQYAYLSENGVKPNCLTNIADLNGSAMHYVSIQFPTDCASNTLYSALAVLADRNATVKSIAIHDESTALPQFCLDFQCNAALTEAILLQLEREIPSFILHALRGTD